MSRSVLMGAAAMLLCCHCLRPGQERARLDLEVGRSEAAGISLVIQDGLAAVQRLEPGLITLWAQAPALGMEIHVDTGGGLWQITLRNALPGSVLAVEDDRGVQVPVETLAASRATELSWRVVLADASHYRLTLRPLDHDATVAFRIAVLSDIQDGVDRLDSLLARINETDVEFVISCGDLSTSGLRGELAGMQARLSVLEIPLFVTPGNHDVMGGARPWHETFGRASLHFVFRRVHFSLVDSAGGTIDPLVYQWLDGWLDEAQEAVHLFATHYPAVDPVGVRNGSLRSRAEGGKLLQALAAHDVDISLYGHVHSYYAFENAGIPAYISGGGGAIEERMDGIGRHFLIVDVIPERRVDQVGLVRVD